MVGVTRLARTVGVSEMTLRRWADNGDIPSLRLPSGQRRFDAEEVRAAMASWRRSEPDPPPAYATGLVLGKFSPPHLGHAALFAHASRNAGEVDLVVVDRRRPGDLPIQLRAAWVRAMTRDLPNVLVSVLTPPQGAPDVDDDLWAQLALRATLRRPDAVFSFEEGRDRTWAESMGATLVVPPGTIPVRSSMIREHPEFYLHYLPQVVRDHYERQLAKGVR